MATLQTEPKAVSPLQVWTVLGDSAMRTAIAASGVVLAVGGGLLLATSDHLVDPVAYGLQMAVLIIGAVAAALVWIKRRPGNRIALYLLAYALAGAVISLQGARNDLLHSLGVLVEPVFFLLGYVLVFAFPAGRPIGTPERLLLAAMSLYFVVGFVPWMFFSPIVVGGGPLAGCTEACPANALMIADRPKLAASFGTDLAWVVIVILTATIVCLAVRMAQASRPRRRTLAPVYAIALLFTIPALAFHGFAAGVLHLDGDTLSNAGWTLAFGRAALAYGLLLAILQASLFAGGALKRLIDQIGGHPSASRLREIVADALDDPSVELVFRVDGSDRFVDSRGEPLASAAAGDRRATTVVDRDDETIAAIWHDPALNTDPELVRAASQAVLLALETGRLETELAESRANMVSARDAERRKVERDLHDGAQQKLVALQIKLALAAGAGARATPRSRPAWPRSATASRTPCKSCATSHTARTPRSCATSGCARHLRPRRSTRRRRPRWSPTGSPATRTMSRRPSTTAASNHCRTWPSTPARAPTPASASPSRRASCASRSSTMASAARSTRLGPLGPD